MGATPGHHPHSFLTAEAIAPIGPMESAPRLYGRVSLIIQSRLTRPDGCLAGSLLSPVHMYRLNLYTRGNLLRICMLFSCNDVLV